MTEFAACSQDTVRSVRLPKSGRVEHKSGADREVPTSPLLCSWLIPSRCARLPSPICPLPIFSQLCSAFLDRLRQRPPTCPARFSPNREPEPSECASLTHQIDDGPVLFSLREMIQGQSDGFMSSQAAGEQEDEQGSVSFSFQALTIGGLPERLTLLCR